MELHIAICDDEQIALDTEADMLHSVLEEMHIKHTISRFKNPEELLNQGDSFNIIILDVEMDIMNGIETAKIIRERYTDCLIFFVTNYENYLDDAFNQHAFRFWTKPLDRRKLIYGIESAINELENLTHSISIRANASNHELMVKKIIYLFTDNKKVHIRTTDGEITASNTYKEIDAQLKDLPYFYPTHRGEYVNFKYIKNYDKNVIFCGYNDESYRVYVSRRRYDEFNEKFIRWVSGK